MKNTAQLMVKNYQKKLAELALIQEQMKLMVVDTPGYWLKMY